MAGEKKMPNLSVTRRMRPEEWTSEETESFPRCVFLCFYNTTLKLRDPWVSQCPKWFNYILNISPTTHSLQTSGLKIRLQIWRSDFTSEEQLHSLIMAKIIRFNKKAILRDVHKTLTLMDLKASYHSKIS